MKVNYELVEKIVIFKLQTDKERVEMNRETAEHEEQEKYKKEPQNKLW